MGRRRLDAELVRRGLAASRSQAQAAVDAGRVTVAGIKATKAASLVADDAPVALSASPRPFASRGGGKLAAALDRFGVDPAGRDCLDAGASTGGFTDCLLRRGAARVAAVDVGYGQLAWELRTDPRVIVLERTNVRDLAPDALPFEPTLAAADLSFISLRLAVPALLRVAADLADVVLLVKPQFEARAVEVEPGGVVRDPHVWQQVLEHVAATLSDSGAPAVGMIASPLRGPAGNVEFFVHARKGGPAAAIDPGSAIEEGRGVR